MSDINDNIDTSLAAETSGVNVGKVLKSTLVSVLNSLKAGLTTAKSEITALQNGLAAKPDTSAVNTALNGKADLVAGKVPANQLPSYVDDVLEFANLAAFPVTGETAKIYVDLATNLTYRWSGSAYVEISSSNGVLANATNVFTKAQRGGLPTIPYAAVIELDFSASNSFNIGVLTGNLTLANPINMPALGETQSGSIYFKLDATGGRILTLGSNFKLATGSPTTLSTAPNAKDRLDYTVDPYGLINYSLAKGVA